MVGVVLACAVALAVLPAVASAAGPPLVGATWVTGVNATAARLHAEIDPNGLSTSYYFEYVSDADYRVGGFASAKTVPSPPGKTLPSTSPSAVDILLSGPQNLLVADTTYHYRAVASNVEDTVDGPERVFTTEGNGTPFKLPDGRAWEMVSPVDKGGGSIAPPGTLFGGGDVQAADGGPGAITYSSGTAFGDAASAPPGSQYISRRTPSGWASENVAAPIDSGAYGDTPDGVPYRVFSTSLARAVLFGGLACRGGLAGCPAPNPPLPGSGAPPGYMAYYLRDNASGEFDSLLASADVAHSAVSPALLEIKLVATSPDLSHLILSSCAALTADATEVPAGPGACDPDETNLYEWSAAGLELVNLLPGDAQGTPGAAIAAPIGAVSVDGSVVYWSHGGTLYLRSGGQTVLVGAGGTFETASSDGSVAFFTVTGGTGVHLRRFDAATGTSFDLTPDGGVKGVLGASIDGDTVYYQDATALRVWRNIPAIEATTTVAPGANAAAPSSYPPATGASRVSADGSHLAFMSEAALSQDNLDAEDGQPDSEVYLYGPAPTADPPVCVSCNPTGERPRGPSAIPGALVNGSALLYKPRALSAAGTRLFFESQDVLSQSDTDGTAPGAADSHSLRDVYQWEAAGVGGCTRSPGCVDLISSGRVSDDGTRFLDASADGSDVFFLTSESLVDADPGSIDVYDARVGGGIPEAQRPVPCINDSCQPLPSPPEDPTPGTLVPNAGNGKLRIFRSPPRRHAKKRHGKRRHRQARGRHDEGRGR